MLRSKDVSTETQGSSSSGQSLRHVAFPFSSFQSLFSVNTSLMNTFFSLLVFTSPSKLHCLSGVHRLWVQGFNTLGWNGHHLACSNCVLMSDYSRGFDWAASLLAASLLGQALWAGHMQEPALGSPSQEESRHRCLVKYPSQTAFCLSSQLFFHYSAPWWHIFCICFVTLHQSHPTLIQTLNL